MCLQHVLCPKTGFFCGYGHRSVAWHKQLKDQLIVPRPTSNRATQLQQWFFFLRFFISGIHEIFMFIVVNYRKINVCTEKINYVSCLVERFIYLFNLPRNTIILLIMKHCIMLISWSKLINFSVCIVAIHISSYVNI